MLSSAPKEKEKTSCIGADFRGVVLTDKMKGDLKTQFDVAIVPRCFRAIQLYIYSKTMHLIGRDFEKEKFDYDFDAYVYAMLLCGAKSKIEFEKIMKLVPEKLKIKKWFFGQKKRVSSYWQIIEKTFEIMPETVVKTPPPPSPSPEKGEYIPVYLESYCHNYHLKPIPFSVAIFIVKTIKNKRDDSYHLIDHMNVYHFTPIHVLTSIHFKDRTLDEIVSELCSYARVLQFEPTPQKIIQSIEMLKAALFFKKYKANRYLPEAAESKEILSSSTRSVLSAFTDSLDFPLRHHSLSREVFFFLDWKFKKQLEPYLQIMVGDLKKEDKALVNQSTKQCRKACAEELLKIWRYKNVGCFLFSSVEREDKSKQLKEQAAALGYDFVKRENSDNGFMAAVYAQLDFFSEEKATAEVSDSDNMLKDGLAYTKIIEQLSLLMDIQIFKKVIGNQSNEYSISRNIYSENRLVELIMIALARAIRANVVIIQNDGAVIQHVENRIFPTCYFGFDGDNYYSLHRNLDLKQTRILPPLNSTIRAVPSVSELKASFFNWPAYVSSSTSSMSSKSNPSTR